MKHNINLREANRAYNTETCYIHITCVVQLFIDRQASQCCENMPWQNYHYGKHKQGITKCDCIGMGIGTVGLNRHTIQKKNIYVQVLQNSDSNDEIFISKHNSNFCMCDVSQVSYDVRWVIDMWRQHDTLNMQSIIWLLYEKLALHWFSLEIELFLKWTEYSCINCCIKIEKNFSHMLWKYVLNIRIDIIPTKWE